MRCMADSMESRRETPGRGRSLLPADPREVESAIDPPTTHPGKGVRQASHFALGHARPPAPGTAGCSRRRDVARLTIARSLQPDGSFAPPKTAKGRRVLHLTPGTVAAFRCQRAIQAAQRLAAGPHWTNPADLVFTNGLGTALDHNNVPKHFHTALRRAEVTTHHSLYDLRHTAATLLLDAGTPLKVVSEALGHASIVLTADVHSHVTARLRASTAEAMAAIIG